MQKNRFLLPILALLVLLPSTTPAEIPWQFSDNTRYLAMGDSLAAGYGAIPATQGYAYLLYQGGIFDTVPNTLFANAAVPGATSADILSYQVPQAVQLFRPSVITLSVGGNDLLAILNGADPGEVLLQFQEKLTTLLFSLREGLPRTQIYLHNLYIIPEIPESELVVPLFNQVMEGVASAFLVPVADVQGAFAGKKGLLLIQRHDTGMYEVHPSNAGHRAIARAFREVIP